VGFAAQGATGQVVEINQLGFTFVNRVLSLFLRGLAHPHNRPPATAVRNLVSVRIV
jgi:hypothetical protein